MQTPDYSGVHEYNTNNSHSKKYNYNSNNKNYYNIATLNEGNTKRRMYRRIVRGVSEAGNYKCAYLVELEKLTFAKFEVLQSMGRSRAFSALKVLTSV